MARSFLFIALLAATGACLSFDAAAHHEDGPAEIEIVLWDLDAMSNIDGLFAYSDAEDVPEPSLDELEQTVAIRVDIVLRRRELPLLPEDGHAQRAALSGAVESSRS